MAAWGTYGEPLAEVFMVRGCVDLHAIAATPARWRDDGASTAAPSSRNHSRFPHIDVSSSSTAAGALRILKSCSKSLVMDLAFVLEGQSEEALPEKILGTVEWNHFDLDPDNSPVIKVCAEDN